ncbi:two-component sensor histidine kinase [Sulfitobacter undariae]|uniref:histidine kinase n=1 Tax=Sulfitobacter undariae TaxID=1563671 RepID=A0A7W6E0F4_9RHOB|nr:two-component sensor histidine kinase [Sulfitobacter undariae]
MTLGFLRNSFFGGLTFRILLFLSLALLPIGLIAVVQTRQIADQSQSSAELSLIAVTDQAATGERTTLQEALGAGRALAAVVKLIGEDSAQCSGILRGYDDESKKFLLVGFVQHDGMMACSSSDKPYDLVNTPVYQAAMERGTVTVSSVERSVVTDGQVVIVTVPVFDGEEVIGFVYISIARDTLEDHEIADFDAPPLSFFTYNDLGQLLTTDQHYGLPDEELPAAYTLNQLTGPSRQVFSAKNQAGIERVYVVVPLIQGTAFAMTVWPSDTPMLQTDFSGRISTLLPIVMWLASLIVAFWSLNRLAITHIRKLGRQMRHFALNRTLPRMSLGERVPFEIFTMEQTFLGMAKSILQDEARQEDSLREKNILLKEVHHRVKNNLQLISSIMSMQIRQAPTEANRKVLQRLQDRILSLATVHKSLYQDDEMSRVDAGILLREIVSQSLAVGLPPNANVDIKEDYDNIMIGADDAAPMSLLVSEAVTNALKYISADTGGAKRIVVSLKKTAAETAQLRVENTLGDVVPESGTGLGSRLIQAFTRQLGGTLEIDEAEDVYKLELTFPVPLAEKKANDF